jgi:hypothetical protein
MARTAFDTDDNIALFLYTGPNSSKVRLNDSRDVHQLSNNSIVIVERNPRATNTNDDSDGDDTY